MFPLAVAIIFSVIVFTIYPPKFTFIKVLRVEDTAPTSEESPKQKPLTEKEVQEAYADAPPNIDDLVEGINQILYDIQGDD